jgi:putative heme-binding domain-containing protein
MKRITSVGKVARALSSTCLAVALGNVATHSLNATPFDERPPSNSSSTNPSTSTPMVLETSTKSLNQFTFTIAKGLELTNAVEDGLIQWPIAATKDRQGNLLVLECHWNRQSVQDQLQSKPHKVVRLSDTNSDGIFDDRFVIASDLGFPEGIMVLGEDILVSAPPNILRLSDSDRDGFYEKHDVWFDGTTLTYCANDLHGPMMGPDGWIYWTKGAFGEQNHELIRKPLDKPANAVASKAAHIYRRHPNGGPIERLMTGGMDNPSDITFSPEGDIFFCSTFLHHPGNGLRDGIAHAPRGGLFGKQHGVLEGHWETGPLLEPIANLGPAAPASVNYLSSPSIPQSLWGTTNEKQELSSSPFLASAQFNLQKIGLHRLISVGSSFETQTVDLLTADRIDFHPVDILEESDGSLLIFDTGSWYDLCCPSSGNDRAIEKGGIYRLTPSNRSTADNANSVAELSLKEAQQILLNPKLEGSVRVKALWKIARHITRNQENLLSEKVPNAKRVILAMLADQDIAIQQAAARITGLNRWSEAKPKLESMLSSRSPAVVRSAIESLGIVGDAGSIEKILVAATRFPDDRMLEHACIYAMLELDHPTALIRLIRQDRLTSDQRYLLLYALQQMGGIPSDLVPDLAKLLSSSHERLRSLVVRNLIALPNGLDHCIDFLNQAWDDQNEATLTMSLPMVRSLQADPKGLGMMEPWLRSASSESELRQRWLLSALDSISGESLPDAWTDAITHWLERIQEPGTLESVADTVGRIKFTEQQKPLAAQSIRKIAEKNLANPQVVLYLLAACPETESPLEDAMVRVVIDPLMNAEGDQSTSKAEDALTRLVLSTSQAITLVNGLDKVAPLALPTVIDALLKCKSDQVDSALLDRLSQVASAKTLSSDRLLSSLKDRPDAMKATWLEKLEEASKPSEEVEKSISSWLERLADGDAKRGYDVFRSAKAACSSCHQVGYLGGNLGPELSRIGQSRTRRDLVASILFPSLHLAQGYYPIRIRTNEGEVINGLLSKQTDDYVELTHGVNKVARIPRSEIEEQAASTLSVMPAGLEQQLTAQEFADLVSYLESRR